MKFGLKLWALIPFWMGFGVMPLVAETFATYNIRTDSKVDRVSGDEWEKRLPRIVELARRHDFDVFAIQEAQPHQLVGMKGAFSEYEFSGVGRDDGKEKGEFVGVFYKKEKYQKLEEGVYWLSETPEVPSKGWDAMLPRICSWVKLEDRATKRASYFFALHFDHLGEHAKLESARMVLERAKQIAKGSPAVILGDFNFTENEPGFEILKQSKDFKEAHAHSKKVYAPSGTFNRFDPDQVLIERIDHILVSAEYELESYAIVTDMYLDDSGDRPEVGPPYVRPAGERGAGVARFPSDHFPVRVEVQLK